MKTKALVAGLGYLFAILTSFQPDNRAVAAPGTLLQQYQDPAQQSAARFGASVAGYGNQPLVGAPLTDVGGNLYLFDSGASATPVKTFSAPGSFDARSFGSKIATLGTEILVSDTGALPLSGVVNTTSVTSESTPDNFRGVAVHYASANDASPKVLINPLVGAGTAFGSSMAFRSAGKFAVGDPFITSSTLPQVGVAYVYNDPSSTSPTLRIDNPAPASQARFARALAFYQDELVPDTVPGEETSYHGALAVGAPGLSAVFQFSPENGNLLSIMESPDSSTDAFGFSLATADTRLVVGAPNATVGTATNAGKVYVYDRFTGVLQRTITSNSPRRDSFFGYDLAMLDSSHLVVGNWSPGTSAGSVLVIDINTGVVSYTLTSPNTKRPQFGSAVAAVGANVLVGDPIGASDASTGVPGRAYLFGLTGVATQPPAAPTGLSATAVNPTTIQLTFGDNSTNETAFTLERRVGTGAYSLVATLAANSTSYTDTTVSPATAYTYRLRAFNNAGTSAYSNEASATTPAVVPPDLIGEIPNPGQSGDLFGFSVAKVGKLRLAIGAPGADTAGTSDSGKVYVFTPPSLVPTLTLSNPDPHNGDQFGYSVSSVGENILVGAPGREDDFTGSGVAYLFNGSTGQVMFTYHHPNPYPGAQFGFSVAGYGTRQALIGAPGAGPQSDHVGDAHLFDAKKTGALVMSLEWPNISGEYRMGTSVAAAKKTAAVVGTMEHGNCRSSVYLFSLKTGTGTGAYASARSVTAAGKGVLVGAPHYTGECGGGDPGVPEAYLLQGVVSKRIYSNPSHSQDAFGWGVAGAKKFAAIGAPTFSNGGDDFLHRGRAYLFTYKSSDPVRTFDNPFPDEGDQFGRALAFPGKLMLAIGAPYDDTHGTDAGAVYLFSVPKK